MGTPACSIVVHIYNEQEALPELCRRLQGAIARLSGSAEIVFVDDGSVDGARAILAPLQREDERIRLISLAGNFGHRAAISAGLACARGAAVGVLDGDLRDPPGLLPAFFQKLDEGWDVAYGVRQRRKEGFAERRLDHFVFYRLPRLPHDLANIDIPLDAGDFCVMSRRVVDQLNRPPGTDRFVRLPAWLGFRQLWIRHRRDRRHAGTSKDTILGLVERKRQWLPRRPAGAPGFVHWLGLPRELATLAATAFHGLSWIRDYGLGLRALVWIMAPWTRRGRARP